MDSCFTYMKVTHPLTDAPSVRILKFALVELKEMFTVGTQFSSRFGPPEDLESWHADVLSKLSFEAGTLDGTCGARQWLTMLPRLYSSNTYTYDPVPQRDERFADLWNQGVNAEAFLYDPGVRAEAQGAR